MIFLNFYIIEYFYTIIISNYWFFDFSFNVSVCCFI